jgi:signal transduction histidine kinase
MVYGYTVSAQTGDDFRLTASALLRVPFLFVVALFYGYFVAEIRGRRNEAVEARLRDEAKTELLAAVSHDLRAPLGNAQNLLELALDCDEGEMPDRGLIMRAQVNIQRVVSLVSNLLQTASMKNGEVRLHLANAQINDVVEDAIHLQTPAAAIKEIAVERQLDAHIPVTPLDTMQLGRVVNNLLDNAIKYCPKGGTVRLATSYDAHSLRIAVRDSGPGMNEEQCQQLFAPYRRVHIGGYSHGMGLGLYIVKCLTEAMGGTIEVASEVGRGSTFTVTLARATQEAPRVTSPVPAKVAPAPILRETAAA